MDMEEFDTWMQDQIVCPYCGCKFEDSWQWDDDDNSSVKCDDCSKDFRLNVDFDVSYTTTKLGEM